MIQGIRTAAPIFRSIAPRAEQPTAATQNANPAAKVELSGADELHTKMMAKLKGQTDIRQEKVAAIRAAIANGTYETDAKLDIAAGRLLDDLL
jgi:negative regulator of flagellin synthesis FlgM